MNNQASQDLWLDLAQAGLTQGERPTDGESSAPWFIRALLGISAWLAALFVLGFIGVVIESVFRSEGAALAVGCLLCAGGVGLFRIPIRNDFLTQSAFAISLAGQVFVLVGLAGMFDHGYGGWFGVALAMAGVEIALFFLVSQSIHRSWSAFAAALALLLAAENRHLGACTPYVLSFACAWLWLCEFRRGKHAPMLRDLAGGLTAGLLWAVAQTAATERGLLHEWRGEDFHAPDWLGPVAGGLCGVALLWALWRWLRHAGCPLHGPGARSLLLIGVVLAAASVKAPGLAPTVLLLFLGYAHGNRVLLGVGVAALLGYLGFYYYALNLTLLDKSIALAGTGALLLALRAALRWLWPATAEPEASHA